MVEQAEEITDQMTRVNRWGVRQKGVEEHVQHTQEPKKNKTPPTNHKLK